MSQKPGNSYNFYSTNQDYLGTPPEENAPGFYGTPESPAEEAQKDEEQKQSLIASEHEKVHSALREVEAALTLIPQDSPARGALSQTLPALHDARGKLEGLRAEHVTPTGGYPGEQEVKAAVKEANAEIAHCLQAGVLEAGKLAAMAALGGGGALRFDVCDAEDGPGCAKAVPGMQNLLEGMPWPPKPATA